MNFEKKIKYNFLGKIWKINDKGGWHFISLPNKISKEIRKNLKWEEQGWGRMKISAKIQNIEWNTAIWFDTKLNTYVLPIKVEIRKKASIKLNDIIPITIYL